MNKISSECCHLYQRKSIYFFIFPLEAGTHERQISSIKIPVEKHCSLSQMQDLGLLKAQHIHPGPGTRHLGSEYGFQDLKHSVKYFLLSHLRAYNYYLLQTSVARCFEYCNATVSIGKCFLLPDANHCLHLCLGIFVCPTRLTQVFSGAVLVAITRWCSYLFSQCRIKPLKNQCIV